MLITGANSYVGTNVEKWLMRDPENYYVETLDMMNLNWKNFDFSKFDVVFHVAGIAHVSTKKKMKELYFKVNKDLTIETALKAKESGVKQFIFMSSMIVYNSKETLITRETIPKPKNFYGLSKLEAEKEIAKLGNLNFNVSILRPPIIYGPNSKGNFKKLQKIAKKSPIFFNFPNKRSMLFIDNLSEFIKVLINNNDNGIFFPQNSEYFKTSDIVLQLARCYRRVIWMTRIFNPIIFILRNKFSIINKIFGDFYYEIEMSKYGLQNYIVCNNTESLSFVANDN